MLELVAPATGLRAAWTEAHAEWGPGFHEDGFGLWARDDVGSAAGFAAWVARLREQEHRGSTARWIVEDGRVLGGIALRHGLDERSGVVGQIGYGIRPSARRRGVATWALGRMLVLAQGLGLDRVLIVCEEGNTASARTIERNGGVLEAADGSSRRYWIGLDPLVRPARAEDLAALERHLPTGRNRYHEARYGRQNAGLGTFLLALRDGEPVGHAEILWPGAKAAEVRERFPGCPEINGLAVAVALRSRGIGTALIRAAEALAAGKGRERVGLGVDENNVRAAELYRRLGYAETGCHYVGRYTYVDDTGRHEVADRCRFLVKDLQRVHGAG